MEPKHNNDFPPTAELPPLQEAGGSAHAPEQSVAATPETRGMHMPGAGGPAASAAMSQPPALPQTDSQTAASAQSGQVASAGLIADDTDLIEKEWVMKAKAIVMQTKSDPHMQNVQMNGIKADYLKKRYNKDLKTSGT